MRLQSKHKWRKDVLLITSLLYIFLHILYSILLLKTQTCFTFWDILLPNRVKVILLFRNNATRFYYKIQRRKFVIFSHIWGTRKHKLPRKSGLTIYWMGRVGLWKTSRSKIDLRLVPYKNLAAFYEN